MFLNSDTQDSRLNSDPNGQSKEKDKYFCSPVFVMYLSNYKQLNNTQHTNI